MWGIDFCKEKRSITSHIKKMYNAYFDCYLGDQDKSWTPHMSCVICVKKLSVWYAEKNVYADEHSSGEYVEPNDPERQNKPIPLSQEILNDLRRDVYLTKEISEFAASRLQERNFLEKGVKITL